MFSKRLFLRKIKTIEYANLLASLEEDDNKKPGLTNETFKNTLFVFLLNFSIFHASKKPRNLVAHLVNNDLKIHKYDVYE